MKKLSAQILLVSTMLLALTIFAEAQTKQVDETAPKVIRAVAVTKYPFGNFKGAKGTVSIQVKIDFNGKVVKANAISGHPILRKMCEDKAKKWLFEPNENKNQQRTIVLNFIFTKAENEDEEGIFFEPPYSIEIINSEVR